MHDEARRATARRYHDATKHHPHRFAPGPGYLDWANQPDSFRRFEDIGVEPLPLIDGSGFAAYDSLFAPNQGPPAPVDRASLGLFLELALGLSAWKEFQGTRWALRNNPSSGNLHPTEGYVAILRPAADGPRPGIYHYAPRQHALERRCTLPTDLAAVISEHFAGSSLLAGLTSIHWREAWKSGERAYRYCQHDAGHALAALRFSARVLDWPLRLLRSPSDGDVARLFGLDREGDFEAAEPEHPDCLLAVNFTGDADAAGVLPRGLANALGELVWHGRAKQMSAVSQRYPHMAEVEGALEKPPATPGTPLPAGPSHLLDEPPTRPGTAAADIIRQRRSAVEMDGSTAISLEAFLRMLSRTMPDPARPPWDAFPFAPAAFLCLFVHRVEGLDPGLYLLTRRPERLASLRAASVTVELAWEPVPQCALPLFRLTAPADVRQLAGDISCGQDIAADGAFSLAMVCDLVATLEREGAWAYRRLFWETGMIGQVLYLEAEALGVRGTGIGCYFDDMDHRLLGLEVGGPWQSLYHFTVGGPVEDHRLITLSPYG